MIGHRYKFSEDVTKRRKNYQDAIESYITDFTNKLPDEESKIRARDIWFYAETEEKDEKQYSKWVPPVEYGIPLRSFEEPTLQHAWNNAPGTINPQRFVFHWFMEHLAARVLDFVFTRFHKRSAWSKDMFYSAIISPWCADREYKLCHEVSNLDDDIKKAQSEYESKRVLLSVYKKYINRIDELKTPANVFLVNTRLQLFLNALVDRNSPSDMSHAIDVVQQLLEHARRAPPGSQVQENPYTSRLNLLTRLTAHVQTDQQMQQLLASGRITIEPEVLHIPDDLKQILLSLKGLQAQLATLKEWKKTAEMQKKLADTLLTAMKRVKPDNPSAAYGWIGSVFIDEIITTWGKNPTREAMATLTAVHIGAILTVARALSRASSGKEKLQTMGDVQQWLQGRMSEIEKKARVMIRKKIVKGVYRFPDAAAVTNEFTKRSDFDSACQYLIGKARERLRDTTLEYSRLDHARQSWVKYVSSQSQQRPDVKFVSQWWVRGNTGATLDRVAGPVAIAEGQKHARENMYLLQEVDYIELAQEWRFLQSQRNLPKEHPLYKRRQTFWDDPENKAIKEALEKIPTDKLQIAVAQDDILLHDYVHYRMFKMIEALINERNEIDAEFRQRMQELTDPVIRNFVSAYWQGNKALFLDTPSKQLLAQASAQSHASDRLKAWQAISEFFNRDEETQILPAIKADPFRMPAQQYPAVLDVKPTKNWQKLVADVTNFLGISMPDSDTILATQPLSAKDRATYLKIIQLLARLFDLNYADVRSVVLARDRERAVRKIRPFWLYFAPKYKQFERIEKAAREQQPIGLKPHEIETLQYADDATRNIWARWLRFPAEDLANMLSGDAIVDLKQEGSVKEISPITWDTACIHHGRYTWLQVMTRFVNGIKESELTTMVTFLRFSWLCCLFLFCLFL